MLDVIYEDKNIVALNKPSGVVVNKTNTSDEESLQEAVVKSKIYSHFFTKDDMNIYEDKDISQDVLDAFFVRNGLVHRIDKGTSGVVLFAKDPETFFDLQKQFKERNVSKEYVALVFGELKEERIEINAPLGRNPYSGTKMAIVETGKPSLTVVEKMKPISIKDGNFTLVRAKPITGRTHQIRIHLTAINHPVVGDDMYAGRKRRELTKDKYGRLMLHAHKLTINHPKTGKKMTFEAPIPSELSY